jgi:hypothetical protein
VEVTPLAGVTQSMFDQADLVVVGGLTHVRGVSRESTRKAEVDVAANHCSSIPGSEGARGSSPLVSTLG